MSLEGVAARYAQALLELGTEQGNLPSLTAEIRRAGETYGGSHELRSVLDNPLVPESARKAILDEVGVRLGLGPLAKNTLGLLAQRNRLAALPHIARSLDQLSDAKAGVVRAVVTTAKEMPETFHEKLRTELERKTGKKIVVEKRVDPTLLGGVHTRIGDRTIDGSIKAKLDALKSELANPLQIRIDAQRPHEKTTEPCSFAPKRSARSSRRTSRASTRPPSSTRRARC